MSLSVEIESTMSIRGAPLPNIYAVRHSPLACDWCDRLIWRGHKMNLFAPHEFTGFIRDLLTRISIRKRIPIGVSILISKFLFKPTRLYCMDNDIASQPFRLVWNWGGGDQSTSSHHEVRGKEAICLNCYHQQTYTTRSGRASKKPINQIIRTVPGSGIVGCDQYDRSFDGTIDGPINVPTRRVPLETGDLKDFIVSDEELTSQHAIIDTFEYSEEEFEFSDYETSEEEDDGPCWLDSDEEG